jgi:hypothetical protein
VYFSGERIPPTMYTIAGTAQSFILRGTGTTRIDWGDGTYTDTTLTQTDRTITHSYATSDTFYIKFYSPKNYTKFEVATDKKLRIETSQIQKFVNLDTLRLRDNLVYGSISSLPTDLTYLYLNSIGTNLTGSISSLPTDLTYLYLNSIGTNLTGSISSLPTGLTYLYLSGLGTNLTGSISSLPTGLTYLVLSNLGANLTGSINSLPTHLTDLSLINLGTNLTGSISSLPTGLTYLSLINLGNSIIIDTGTMKAWASTVMTITPQTSYGYTTAKIDGFLNLWAITAVKSTSKNIDLRGANQPRSSASNTAVDTLTARLKVILTNP